MPTLNKDSGTSEKADGPLEEQVALLERQVLRSRWRSLFLGAGTLATVVLISVVGWSYFASTVLSYAQLQPDIRIERDSQDPERLKVSYCPVSAGRVAIRRFDQNRETELIDRVTSGERQQLEWKSKGLKTGDEVLVTFRRGWSLAVTRLSVPEAPAPSPLGKAVLKGEVVNATNNEPVPGADVRLVGTPLHALTDGQGRFRIAEAPDGPVAIEVSAANYSTDQAERNLSAIAETAVRFALSPGMQAGQLRVILTWGDSPKDLDAHLEGPLPNEQRFHIFHKEKGDLKSRAFVNLDVDDRDGQGPETITVLGVVPGTYRFFVHNATNENPQGEERKALARSNAEVRILQGGQSYRFRTSGESEGNIWRVCDIDVTPQGVNVRRIDKYEMTTAEQEHLYSKRTRADRAEWIGLYGGTANSEQAVTNGLAWLARHQAVDGHWGIDCLAPLPIGRCEGGNQCPGPGTSHHMAHTGLALLAFQAGGHYSFNERQYSKIVQNGIDWLVKNQKDDGGLYDTDYDMYEHGIAAFALCEACAVAIASRQTIEPSLREAAEKAIRFIERQQHNDGGWRYTSDRSAPSDTSVAGWQMLALKSAKEARINVTPACIQRAIHFFEGCQIGRSGRTGYQGSTLATEATTGVGMLVQSFLLDTPDSAWNKIGAEYLCHYAESNWKGPNAASSDFYLWYNCTLAEFQVGGDSWKRWNDVVREHVIKLQDQTADRCTRGSWAPEDRWGAQGGRVYTTALAVLILEVYYRYNSERAKVYGQPGKPASP